MWYFSHYVWYVNKKGEQFRQIAHYLAEHLIQKNDILLNEKFLTLWMQECKYSGMHISKYASKQVCKYTIMQAYKYVRIQVYKIINIEVSEYAST